MLRLLLVDDNPDDRLLMMRHLRKEFGELEVVQVIDMEQFQEALRHFDFDLVITDYYIRWTDGLSVLRAVRAQHPDCPVVMFTGTGSEEVAVQAMKEGVDDYVLKSPQHFKRLAASARRALESAAQRRALREAETRYQRLFESVPVGLFRMTLDGALLEVNNTLVDMLRFPDKERLLAVSGRDLALERYAPGEELSWPPERGAIMRRVVRLRCGDGDVIWAAVTMRRVSEEAIEGSVQDITETQERSRYLAFLADITRLALEQNDQQVVLRELTERLRELFFADSCFLTRWDTERRQVVAVTAAGLTGDAYRPSASVSGEGTLTHAVLQQGRVLAVADVFDSPHLRCDIAEKFPVRSALALPLQAHGRDLGAVILGYNQAHTFTERQVRRAEDLAAHLALVLSTASLVEETRQRLSELESVRRASLQVTSSLDLQTVLSSILRQIHDLLPVDNTHIFLYDGHTLTFGAAVYHGAPLERPVAEPRSDGVTANVARHGERMVIEAVSSHPMFAGYPLPFRGALASFPLRAGGHVRGVLNVAYEQPHAFQPHEIRILELLADQAAIAIQNAELYESVQRGYRRLQSLQTIDNAITASMDVRITLGVFLEQVIRQLDVDAAAIALYNTSTATLEYTLTQGIPRHAFPRRAVRLGVTLSGRIALRKEMLIQDGFTPEQNGLDTNALTRIPKVYVGMPLVAKGELQGVLDMYHYSAFKPDGEWIEFAHSLATQAAIAIENAKLFDRLQRSNFELELAYDQTLEGWARALELRGVEPEGHTTRVVELCLALAQKVVFDPQRLLSIRRGTILHDIGKIAVPDAILLKPGPLDDAEWQVVRQHPVYARQLLAPIGFLRRALEIPYSHHERWDGTGYPQGTAGERIPLGARIFALVDVWDSLTSERPYRAAWPPEKALHYIETQAGKQFDPNLTLLFLDLLRERFMRLP